jgi:hypothetical protein
MAGQPSHRRRRFVGHSMFSQRCHAPGMVTLEVSDHLKLKEKSCFVTIPAPAAGTVTRYTSAPVPMPWSAATSRTLPGSTASPVRSWTASTNRQAHIEVPRVEAGSEVGQKALRRPPGRALGPVVAENRRHPPAVGSRPGAPAPSLRGQRWDALQCRHGSGRKTPGSGSTVPSTTPGATSSARRSSSCT